ncbi:hypothetical protein WDW89_10465 [Deltaproteobacteria bacterium TL4]
MEKERHSISTIFGGLVIGLIISIAGKLLQMAQVVVLIGAGTWLVRHFTSFPQFEATLVSIGIFGIVWLNLIANKISAVHSYITQEDFFYDDEEDDDEDEEDFVMEDKDASASNSAFQRNAHGKKNFKSPAKVIPLGKKDPDLKSENCEKPDRF